MDTLLDRLLSILSKPHHIKSIEDFKDPRSIEIIETYKLKIENILPEYLKLLKECRKSRTSMEIEVDIDLGNSTTSINQLISYIKKLACAIVVCYEFTKSRKITFPLPQGFLLSNFENKIINLRVIKLNGIITRISSIMTYETCAMIYLELIDRLYQEQNKLISKRIQSWNAHSVNSDRKNE